MKKPSFLHLVSEHFAKNYGKEMENQVLVFPNRRSILFFSEEWQSESEKPKWQPECITIQDLYAVLSELTVADDITLIVELYKAIKSVDADILAGADGSFEKFYDWGRTLISDFDDIDKNMVNAEALFGNIADIEAQRNLDHISEEQEKAIKSFFNTFSKEEQERKLASFVALWRNLTNIYFAFRKSLLDKGVAYEGMANRMAIEMFEDGKKHLSDTKTYHFIGFNLLHTTEEKMFRKLDRAGRAKFYWDYDDFYVMNGKESADEAQKKQMREAGYFMMRNLYKNGKCRDGYKFKQELDASCIHNFTDEKRIKYIATTTDNAQAKYLDEYCRRLRNDGDIKEREVAIVLCDENLLLPVLHSIPEECNVNITMGFPLVQTPAYALLKNMLDYQSQASSRIKSVPFDYVSRLVRSPYIVSVLPEAMAFLNKLRAHHIFYVDIEKELEGETEELRNLLLPTNSPKEMLDKCLRVLRLVAMKKPDELVENGAERDVLYTDLYQEALFRVHSTVVQFRRSLDNVIAEMMPKNGEVIDAGIEVPFVAKLVSRALATLKVPFSGEPIRGLQIMGFLETRGLDFSHVCMLSVGEKILPPEQIHTSFIPNSLRAAVGMTTTEQKVALYAYYFYRVLQRAEDITLIYNSTTTDKKGDGQKSRFMMQIQNETEHKIELEQLSVRLSSAKSQDIVVEKNDEIVEKLKRMYVEKREDGRQTILSPSALNDYLRCPLHFYFKYVLSLKETDTNEDEIEPTMVGDIFHHCMEDVYNKVRKKKSVENGSFEVLERDLIAFKNEEVRTDIVMKWVNLLYFNLNEEAEKALHEEMKGRYSGRMNVVIKVISNFIEKQIMRDSLHTPFVYHASEEKVKTQMKVVANDEELEVCVGGYVDRQDEKDGQYRVVDYKTGGDIEKAQSIDDVFEKKNSRSKRYVFQTFLYSSIICQQRRRDVLPTLSFVNKKIDDDAKKQGEIVRGGSNQDKDTPWVVDKDLANDFMSKTSLLIGEIFSKEAPFVQTTDIANVCEYCEFRTVCKR